MAYNKSKYIEAAQKYLHQGKIAQAITEYQNILKQEPKDQVTLMTVGDLYVRRGETFRALEYFERLAQIFLQDGFTAKAIAIYKKVAKLAPEESRPLERLAELYVQQGVLSEARPIFLQLAEMHLRAGRQQQAAALLKKLLEAEPNNLRVQVRLAELYLTMGQQKDALEAFLAAAQCVQERGDQAEAVRLSDRALQLDPEHESSILLKARALSASGRNQEATGLLEPLSGQNPDGEIPKLLLELYLGSEQTYKAASLAEQMCIQNPKNYAPAHQVAAMLLESGDPDKAQHLLGLVRNAMADAGEQDLLAKILSRLADARPDAVEPAQWLVELFDRKNDMSRLPGGLLRLARAFAAVGDNTKALETYEQLLNRTSMDPTAQREYANLRSAIGLEPAGLNSSPSASPAATHGQSPSFASRTEPDEETQRYVTQALTDVDLFSSYGLTQKAVELLENILRRAPHHVPALERLLDVSVGAGNDGRTVELAATLERIAVESVDDGSAERYAELRRRFQRNSADGSPQPVAFESLLAAAPASSAASTAVPAPPFGGAPEFKVPMIEAELIEDAPIEQGAATPEPLSAEAAQASPSLEAVVHEVDLSQEWAALSQQIELSVRSPQAVNGGTTAKDKAEEEATSAEIPQVSEPWGESEEAELEDLSLTADELFSDLSQEVEAAAAALSQHAPESTERVSPPVVQNTSPNPETASAGHGGEPVAARNGSPAGAANRGNGAAANGASAGPLGDLFDQFRSDMGDSPAEQEDPETHYNLGVAYREMGLLDEAISEFQKVYKADQNQAFRYSMQCCTLLALAFREKGQPAIASMWYERALLTPGLNQESILALRYDLGVAQEMAGDTEAAFKSFSQVYAMNIDYRDVAERVALLGKAR